jgi:hypothetical protein
MYEVADSKFWNTWCCFDFGNVETTGNADGAGTMQTIYWGANTQGDGKRPAGYSPMKKQGAIVMGTGGDGSPSGSGIFFEGAITIGCPDDNAVDDAIAANVVAAG